MYLKEFFSICFILLVTHLTGQQHFEFDVTDTEGVNHNLYQDYLNQGKTVVIKIFFVACPPCNGIAKDFQAKYVEWGEGAHDVEFMEITTQSGDDDTDVIGYKNKHGITFPSISQDGGAGSVTNQYKSGYFGTYWGTPSFAVIAPDGSTDYGPGSLSTLDDLIAATGARKPGEEVQNTIINLNLSWSKDQPGDMSQLEVILQSSNGGPQYDIMNISNGTLSFEYPSDLIPDLVDPVLKIEYNGTADVTKGVSASDITVMRKHILDIEPFQSDERVAASDVNGDGKVSSIDIITLRKVILGFDLIFPNSVKSYTPDRNDIPVLKDPGGEIDINVKMIKMGDLN